MKTYVLFGHVGYWCYHGFLQIESTAVYCISSSLFFLPPPHFFFLFFPHPSSSSSSSSPPPPSFTSICWLLYAPEFLSKAILPYLPRLSINNTINSQIHTENTILLHSISKDRKGGAGEPMHSHDKEKERENFLVHNKAKSSMSLL